MSSSHEIPNQEMEMQGLRGDENVAVYENSANDRNNIYEELRVQASAKSDGREKRSSRKGKILWVKTIFAIVCFIVGIAIAWAAIVLFIKVMNNEKKLENFKEIMMNNKKALEDFKEILKNKEKTLEELNGTMMNNKEALKESLSMLHSLSANFNKTSDLEALVPVSGCDQTSINGVHTLISSRKVYCSDGWTVFQRRMDGSIPDFHTKTWNQYRDGFGKFTEEFWLGLRKLHEITQQGGCRLRVDLQSWDNDKAYAEYSVGGYSGTAGDSLTMNNGFSSIYNINGMAFSTNEKHNYKWSWTNCAEDWNTGGWWYNTCLGSSLNGLYTKSSLLNYGMKWETWKAWKPMKFTQMGVRCD